VNTSRFDEGVLIDTSVSVTTGTLDYMAPEILMLPVSAQGEEPVGQKEYDEQVDAW
jgi:hypothetical protein